MGWVIASDHAGLPLKQELLTVFAAMGVAVHDLGTHSLDSVDYPDFAHRLAGVIAAGEYLRGVLVCGTGIGVCITANRHRGVRAALCSDVYSARMARMHNDANVLCLGSRVLGAGLAEEILRAFVTTEFAGERHQRRIDKIDP